MIYREHVGKLIKKTLSVVPCYKEVSTFFISFSFFSKNLLPTSEKRRLFTVRLQQGFTSFDYRKKRDLRPGNLAYRCGLHIQLASIIFYKKYHYFALFIFRLSCLQSSIKPLLSPLHCKSSQGMAQ